jgi:hypothetical protein
MKKFKVRVNHELGFFSFYEVEAEDYNEAEKKAKQMFLNEFCGGRKESDESDLFPGVVYKLECFTFNKYKQ